MKGKLQASCFAVALAASSVATAQTGVSNDRVSLPEGPGSLEGVGDDVAINANMGAMSYAVPLGFPEGFEGLTPDIGVSYSSAAGAGILGVGWDLAPPSIERLTFRGVPEYDLDDEFTSQNGELVYVGGTNPREYRARFEGAFIRYRWHDPDAGAEGFWTAEYPDGRVAYFGATEAGGAVGSARLGGDDGTFRYNLVSMTDQWGHRIEYTYDSTGDASYLTGIAYVFEDESPRYRIELTYQDRADRIVDALGGFEEVIDQRLERIEVYVDLRQQRAWNFIYEDYDASGGFSRLARVDRFGLDGEPYPASLSFGYQLGLGQICQDATCERPVLRSLGNIGVNLQSGDPQLIDINGDSLPDIVDSTLIDAPHRIFLNTLEADGAHYFASHYESSIGEQDGFDFSNPRVQVLDLNGDGFTDVVNALTGEVLVNRGNGDWESADSAWVGDTEVPDFASDFSEDALQTIRFIDYDNDRKIDIVRAAGAGSSHTTQFYRNTGAGFDIDELANPILIGFDSDTLELNDFNGDGLLDAVQVFQTTVRYRLNLGHGNWAPADDWYEADLVGSSLEVSETDDAELEDINGDGLSDLVLIRGSEIEMWVNRAGQQFESLGLIGADDVDTIGGAGFPAASETTTVLFADMNGNGSSDVVWVTAAGDATYLELFPVRPNLMSEIDNGMGLRIDVAYTTSVEESARDEGSGGGWEYRLPFPNVVVKSITETVLATGVTSLTTYDYHDGFYDGIEKQFRGYQFVEQFFAGDGNQAGGELRQEYATGDGNPHAAGNLLAQETLDDSGTSLQLATYEFAFCDIAEVDEASGDYDVLFWCPTANETELREGAPESEWATLRQEFEYDLYGNVRLSADLGVVLIGGGACGPCDAPGEYGAPCGADCSGDETYEESWFIAPGDSTSGNWLTQLPYRSRTYATPDYGDDYSEVNYYYDGQSFEGLDSQSATRGALTRATARVSRDGDVIDVTRVEHDEHGNIVTELEPMAEVGSPGHTTRYEISDNGLWTTAIEAEVGSDTTLRRDFRWDEIWGRTALATDWYRLGSEDPTLSTEYAYDAFGRNSVEVVPGGDTLLNPTAEHTFEIASPISRAITRMRSTPGGEFDSTSVICFDGRGRDFQVRTELADGVWEVRDHTIFSNRGDQMRTYAPYLDSTGECSTDEPTGVLYTEDFLDTVGRPLRTVTVGANGGELENAVEYLPLSSLDYDASDLNPSSPHFDTPTETIVDGQGRTTAIGRLLNAGGEPEWFRYGYDSQGRIAVIRDPHGNERSQEYDFLGRTIRGVDGDRGELTWEYNDNGDVIRQADPTSATLFAYDDGSRLVETWIEDARESTSIRYVWDADDDCPEARCTFAVNEIASVHYNTPMGPASEYLGYDLYDNLTWMQREIAGIQLERGWIYDQLGRLTEQMFPGDRSIEFEYDGSHRLLAIPGLINRLQLTEAGDVMTAEFANGVSHHQNWDEFRRLDGLRVEGPSGDLLSRGLVLDERDNPVRVDDRLADQNSPSAQVEFTYDAHARLLEARFDAGSPFEETVSYGYDAIENMTSRVSSLGFDSPVHNGERIISENMPHAVVQIGDEEIDYDATGRVIRRGDLVTSWDGYGRISSVEDADGVAVEYGYGRGGERVVEMRRAGSRTLMMGETFVIEDGVASIYPSLVDQSFARIEFVDLATEIYTDVAPATGEGTLTPVADGMINAADAWLSFADELGLLEVDSLEMSSVDELLACAARQGLVEFGDRMTWLHRDYLNNLTAVTNEDGEVEEQTLVYPFGAVRWSSTNNQEAKSLSDQRSDDEARTVNFELRDYDPTLSRWMQPDLMFSEFDASELANPWEAMGSYVYNLNSPTTGTDPTGAEFDNSDVALLAQIVDVWANNQIGGFNEPFWYNGAVQGLQEIGFTQSTGTDNDLDSFIVAHHQELVDEFTYLANHGGNQEEFALLLEHLELALIVRDDLRELMDEDDSVLFMDETPLGPMEPQGFEDNLNDFVLDQNALMDNIVDVMEQFRVEDQMIQELELQQMMESGRGRRSDLEGRGQDSRNDNSGNE